MIDPYIVSLLNFDTNFSDPTGKVWTPVNSVPTISTAQFKFGGGSVYLNGANYLVATNSSDFNFGSGDFTIDWWEYRTNNTLYATIFTRYPNINYCGIAAGIDISGIMLTPFSSDALGWNGSVVLGNTIYNKWTHYATTRKGNIFYGFQNGVLNSTATSSISIYTGGSTGPSIGNFDTILYTGYVDELRVLKGICMWTSDFIPPTTAYLYNIPPVAISTLFRKINITNNNIFSDTRIAGSSTYIIHSDTKRLIGAQILNHYANTIRKVIQEPNIKNASKRYISNRISTERGVKRILYIPGNANSILHQISAIRYYVLSNADRGLYYGHNILNNTIRFVSKNSITNSMTYRLTYFLTDELIYSNLMRVLGINMNINSNTKKILFILDFSHHLTKKQIYLPGITKSETYRNVTGYYHPKIYGATQRLLASEVGSIYNSFRSVSEIITSFHDVTRLISSTTAFVNSGTLREVDYITYINTLDIPLQIIKDIEYRLYIDKSLDINFNITKDLYFKLKDNGNY